MTKLNLKKLICLVLFFSKLAFADGGGDELLPLEKDANYPERVIEMKRAYRFLIENGIDLGKTIQKEQFKCPPGFNRGEGGWSHIMICKSSAGGFSLSLDDESKTISDIRIEAAIPPTKENLSSLVQPVIPVMDADDDGTLSFHSDDEKIKISGFLRDSQHDRENYIEINFELTDDFKTYQSLRDNSKEPFTKKATSKWFKGFTAGGIFVSKEKNLCAKKGQEAVLEEIVTGPIGQINGSYILGKGAKVTKSTYFCKGESKREKVANICSSGLSADHGGASSSEVNSVTKTTKLTYGMAVFCTKSRCPSYTKNKFNYCVYCPKGEFDMEKTNSMLNEISAHEVLCKF